MRNISFFLTEPQFRAGTKDVTRRLGWKGLQPGARLMAVRKSQGRKRGEHLVELGEIEVVSVRRERLDAITKADVEREGFYLSSPAEFVEMFCSHMKCEPDTEVTRIEFRRLRCVTDP